MKRVLLLLTIILASATSSESALASGSNLDTCENLVGQLQPHNWACVSGVMTYENAQDGSSGTIEYYEPQTFTQMPKSRTADDLDTWCEPAGICQRQRTIYSEETKANAAYGDSSGARGSFDIVIRTSLNGRSQRWFYTIISDTGPAVTVTPLITCIEEWFVFVNCGDYSLQPVRVGTRHDWAVVNGAPLNSDDKYHSDYSGGIVTPGGFAVPISPIHSRYWVCPPNAEPCAYPSRNP